MKYSTVIARVVLVTMALGSAPTVQALGMQGEVISDAKVGSDVHVPRWQWVNVESGAVQRYSNGSVELSRGGKCGIEEGGTLTVTQIREGTATVAYRSPGNPLGTPCPSGITFNISLNDLNLFESLYQERKKSEAATATETEVILNHHSKVKSISGLSVGQQFNAWNVWIEAQVPILQQYVDGPRMLDVGESCRAVQSGTVIILGFSSDHQQALIEYYAPDGTIGTKCPTGFVGFVPVKELRTQFQDLESQAVFAKDLTQKEGK